MNIDIIRYLRDPMVDIGERQSTALEAIAYLVRSENRVQVLSTLTESLSKPGQDSPGYEPRRLKGSLGISRATLSRILNEFEDRGWAQRTNDGQYVATPQGQHVAIQLEQFVGSVETIQELGEEMAMFPATDLSIGDTDAVYGVHEFDDVTVYEPGAYDQRTLGKALGELTRESSMHYSMAFAAPMDAYTQAVEDVYEAGGWSANELVYSDRLIDWYGPDTWPSRSDLKELLEMTDTRLFRYEGHMPCQLFIFDETVLIENSQAATMDRGSFVESQNPTVRAWAFDLFTSYREKSEEVTAQDIST